MLRKVEEEKRILPEPIGFDHLRNRVLAFDKHISSLDWRMVRYMMYYLTEEWEGMVSVISGLKPAFAFEDEHVGFDAYKFIPPKLPNIIITENGWIADIDAVSSIIQKYSKHFPDVDKDRLTDQIYINSYLNRRTLNDIEEDSSEIIKTGLLLGYPYDSVITYAQGNQKKIVAFSGFGYQFAALPEDKLYLTDHLQQMYNLLELRRVFGRINKRISREFRNSLNLEQDTVKVITIGNNRFLEVHSLNIDKSLLYNQLLLLTDNPLTQEAAELLVDTFGKRYKVRSMTTTRPSEHGTDGKIGIRFDETIKSILDNVDAQSLPYLQLSETAKGFKINLLHINRQALITWLQDIYPEAIQYL